MPNYKKNSYPNIVVEIPPRWAEILYVLLITAPNPISYADLGSAVFGKVVDTGEGRNLQVWMATNEHKLPERVQLIRPYRHGTVSVIDREDSHG